jgi:hypothetical protein
VYDEFMSGVLNSKEFMLNNRHYYSSTWGSSDGNIVNVNYGEFYKHFKSFLSLNNYQGFVPVEHNFHGVMILYPGVTAIKGARNSKYHEINYAKLRVHLERGSRHYNPNFVF